MQDVRRIREHPLAPDNIPIYGFIYDVKTGRLNEAAVAGYFLRTTSLFLAVGGHSHVA